MGSWPSDLRSPLGAPRFGEDTEQLLGLQNREGSGAASPASLPGPCGTPSPASPLPGCGTGGPAALPGTASPRTPANYTGCSRSCEMSVCGISHVCSLASRPTALGVQRGVCRSRHPPLSPAPVTIACPALARQPRQRGCCACPALPREAGHHPFPCRVQTASFSTLIAHFIRCTFRDMLSLNRIE